MTTTEPDGSELSPRRSWLNFQQEKLEEWETRIGMIPFRDCPVKDEAARYMEMGAHERSKLTCDECAEAALVLAQWGAHLGRVRQREESNKNLAYHRVRQLVGHRTNDHKAFSHDERLDAALQRNPEAMAAYLEMVGAGAKSERLFFYSNRVEEVVQAYKTLANTRRRDRQYGD